MHLGGGDRLLAMGRGSGFWPWVWEWVWLAVVLGGCEDSRENVKKIIFYNILIRCIVK